MAIVASGTWWTLDDTGLLDIHCEGDMPFESISGGTHLPPPWWDYRVQITRVIIRDGVTNIRDVAFFGASLVTATIPGSVTSIESGAFNSNDDLSDVYYGGTETQWNAIEIDTDNDPLGNATIHYNASAIVIPTIPVAGLGNPLAAVVQTLNLVIQNVNALLASNSNAANQEGGAT